jgi:hypothetical protein
MKHSWITSLLCVLPAALALCGPAPLRADGAPREQRAWTPALLTATLTPDGVGSDRPGTAYRDFGKIDPLQVTTLEQTFHLRNPGNTAVEIAYIQPSCGCASVVVSADGRNSDKNNANNGTPNRIAPGAQVAVRVTVDMARQHPGHIAKYALVYLKGTNSPAFTLEMRGELPALISFSPHVIDFGRLNAGAEQTVALTVTLDRRLLTAAPPKLICTNPDLIITPQSEATPAAVTSEQSSVTRHYRVSLSRQARLGLITGAMAFVPADAKVVRPTVVSFVQPTQIADAIGETAILSGQIVGKFAASPALLVFGSVPQGQPVTRRIRLNGRTPDILTGLTVSCSLPALSARLIPGDAPTNTPPGATAGMTAVILEITLGAQAPPGGLDAQVTVVARDGERLVIPVIGDISQGVGSRQ